MAREHLAEVCERSLHIREALEYEKPSNWRHRLVLVDTKPRVPTSIVRDIHLHPASLIAGISSCWYLAVFRMTAAANPSSAPQVNSNRMTHLMLTDHMMISGRLFDAMISGGNSIGAVS